VTSLSALLATMSRSEEQTFTITPGEDWGQGRTLYGGITLALAAHAARLAFPTLPPLRAAQAAFTGPASGTLTIKPTMVSAGKSSAFVGVDIITEADTGQTTALRATFCYGVARTSIYRHAGVARPEVAAPDQCPNFFLNAPPNLAPRFTMHFEHRLAGKAGPVSSAHTTDLQAWIRHIDGDIPDNEVSLIALADATPPAAMLMFHEPSPISTATWSMEFLTDTYANRGWHLIRSQGEHVADGYSSQHMHVWDEQGRPLIAAQQLVTIYR